MEIKEDLLNQYLRLQLKYVDFEKYIKNKMENILIQEKIKYQNLTSRIKNIESLKKKIEKTSVQQMLKGNIQNMYDLCGLRIVLYDNQQFSKIYSLIENYFNIINCTNERFEYNANNITIELKENIFKNFRCEIQLVTVMSHNLIEIGHDIFYKDIDNLKEKDKMEYEELEEEYRKCVEDVYKLETRIDTLKQRKDNILENYKILNKIVSDECVEIIHKNRSMSKFYDICNEIMSVIPYLSRNNDKIKGLVEKKIILKLTKNLFDLDSESYIFSEDFVFNNYLRVLTAYYNVWISDSDIILDLLIKYIELKNNPRIERDFFNAIETIINKDINNEEWAMFLSIKNWIVKSEEQPYYRIKMINSIIKNNIEYMKPINYKSFNLTRKEIIYNGKGKELLKEVYNFACNIFLKNQKKNIYSELIYITYNFDFFANDILKFFYDNYEKIHDIYRYDLLRKIYYSFKETTLNSKYYEKIKSDNFYSTWKYLCYDYFDEYVEGGDKKQIERRAKIALNRYIKNINSISQNEIKRLVKNYNKMEHEGINIIYDFKKVLFLIGKKYNKALQVYYKNKNEYIYLGLRSKGERIEKRTDIKVLKAVNNIFVKKVFDEYLESEERKVEKDNLICNIIINRNKKKKEELFNIIKFYNEQGQALLYNNIYFNKEFLEKLNEEQCMQILNNYFICILKQKKSICLDINLLNIFSYYPIQCREFFDQVVKNKKTREMDFRKIYIYEAKNYEQERKYNLKLVIKWIKEYGYHNIYKFYDSIIKIGDKELIFDLLEIVDETNDDNDLNAIAILVNHIRLGIEKWTIVRKILLKSSDKQVEENLYKAMIETGVVSSLYQAYKSKREEIKKVKNEEKNRKCNNFLNKLLRTLKQSMEWAELNDIKMRYQIEIEDEKFKKT